MSAHPKLSKGALSQSAQAKYNLKTKVYPWVVLICCSLFLFYKYLLQVSPSVMSDELMTEFHVHGAGLSRHIFL